MKSAERLLLVSTVLTIGFTAKLAAAGAAMITGTVRPAPHDRHSSGAEPVTVPEDAGTFTRSAPGTNRSDRSILPPAIRVFAVDRAAGMEYPGVVEATSGRFHIDGLPMGRTYDCVVEAGGARLEGVNLKTPRSDYEEEQPLSAEDVATIEGKVRGMNVFENKVEILAIRGNIQHAAVLLNKLRTEPFVNSKPGEVIWRAELWHFERPEETWVKAQDELFVVLHRERIPHDVYARKSVMFDPALGGVLLTTNRPAVDLGNVELPSPAPGIRLRVETTKQETE
jgi:hypothetical protein